jgi:outer membrane protein assembly factor BamB
MNIVKILRRLGSTTILMIGGLLFFGMSFGQLQEGSWSKIHCNMENTGKSSYTGPVTSDLKWTYQTGGEVRSFPAVAEDGTIYFFSKDGNLYALNPDGSFKWSYPTGICVGGPAIGIDGTVYAGSGSNIFYAFRPNGSVKWTYETNGFLNYINSPSIGQDGTIYIGDEGGTLYALDSDGNEKWTFPNGSRFFYPAIGTDGTIYIGDQLRYLTAIYPTSGQQKWRYDFGYGVSIPVIGQDGTIYVTNGVPLNDSLFAINPSGSLKWVIPVDIGNIPAIDNDENLYFSNYESPNFNAYDSSGSLLWSFPTQGGTIHSSAIDSAGRIYFATWSSSGDTIGNRVYALNPDGSLLWSRGLPDTPYYISPAIGLDSTLYIGCADGKLYAFGTPTTGVEEKEIQQVYRYQLLQNRPNPFCKLTAISYQLKAPSYTTLKVYDISGRLIRTLVAGEKKAGIYSISWSGRDSHGKKAASGIYFYRIVTRIGQASDFTSTKKLILLR